MSITAVLFRSKYGASREYALMLGRKIQAEVVENEGLTAELVAEFDTLVLIGGVYAGRISGLDFLRKNRRALEGRRFAVFAVGASPECEENDGTLFRRNMKGELDGIPLFYGRGAFDESVLTLMDKGIVGMARKAAEMTKDSDRSPLDRAILEASAAPVSWVSENYLDPLVSYLSGAF